jgi:CRP-like cAMP-binding protein
MMPTEIEILKSVPFFQDLDTNDLEILAPIIHRVKAHEGEILTQRGTTARALYINLTGNAVVSYDEDRAVTLHHKGDVAGLSAGGFPSIYKGTAVALTDGEWLTIAGQDLVELIQSDNVLGEKIMKKLSDVSRERVHIMNGD